MKSLAKHEPERFRPRRKRSGVSADHAYLCGWKENPTMKAILNGRVVAESDDIVENGGYAYFPAGATRLDWLEKAEKTDSDKACPHGVQFYDVVIGGHRYPRNAWSYESPRPNMQAVGGRFGFWEDVRVT
jgi:uncharacterized protein (DUF427 family)